MSTAARILVIDDEAPIRRFLRTGMGLCQGQTCAKLVKSIVANELKIRPSDLEPATARAPMRPVTMDVLANDHGGK